MGTMSFLEEGNIDPQDEVIEPAPVSEQAPAPAPEPQTPVIDTPAPAQAEPQAPAPVSDEVSTGRLAAILDEREKRQSAERRAEDLQKQIDQFQAQQRQAQQTLPDAFEDPGAYADYQANALRQQTMSIKLDLSEDMARSKHGDALVDSAQQWALQQYRTNPGFQQQVLDQRNPYDFVVNQYNRDRVASEVSPSDFEQFKAWKSAQSQLSAGNQPAPGAQPHQSPAIPPRSQAMASSAGGMNTEVPPNDAEVFSGVFKRT